jgi:hypothetical protein
MQNILALKWTKKNFIAAHWNGPQQEEADLAGWPGNLCNHAQRKNA